MRNASEVLFKIVHRNGVAVVWCPDLGLRNWLATEVESFAQEAARPFRTASVEEAIAAPDRMVLLIPTDEEQSVLDLDGNLDRLRGTGTPRSQPVVLFLVRHGDGARTLAEQAPSLASWIRGSDVDPETLAEVEGV